VVSSSLEGFDSLPGKFMINEGDIVRLVRPVIRDEARPGSLEERMIKNRVLLRVVKTDMRGTQRHLVPEPVNYANNDAVEFCKHWNPREERFEKI
jgi:hypothetical protein